MALRRLAVGPFGESEMVTLAALIDRREAGPVAGLDTLLMPVGMALAELPEVTLSASDAMRLRRGQSVLLRGRDAPILSGVVNATVKGETVAIAEIEAGQLHPRRVFAAG